jgi:hypothetical protein
MSSALGVSAVMRRVDPIVDLEPVLKFFTRKIAVAKNLRKKPAADDFAPMYRHHCASTVRMLEEVMAPFDTNHFEHQFAQSPDQLRTRDGRECAHAATATR